MSYLKLILLSRTIRAVNIDIRALRPSKYTYIIQLLSIMREVVFILILLSQIYWQLTA